MGGLIRVCIALMLGMSEGMFQMSQIFPKVFALVVAVFAVLTFVKLAPKAMAPANNSLVRSSLALLLAVIISIVAFAIYLALATSIWGA